MRDEAVRHGLDASKAKVIVAGVDATLFAPAAQRRPYHARFCVVSVGALRWLKGYEYALMAISELVREGVPVAVHILGGDPSPDLAEPSERARILYTANDLGLEGRIQLHGHVSPREVCSHLQRADALLHMSVSEGLPTVVVEAMASGVPPVATDVGGTREAIRDGVDGFLIPPRDPASAARALRALWRDPGLRLRMGRAGRARVEAEFTIERQTDQWLELYERVALRR
jgi:glycosyltransferase involved in cell wall biosynthesis